MPSPLDKAGQVEALEQIGGALADASCLAIRYARKVDAEKKVELEKLVDRIRDLEQIVTLWAEEATR